MSKKIRHNIRFIIWMLTYDISNNHIFSSINNSGELKSE